MLTTGGTEESAMGDSLHPQTAMSVDRTNPVSNLGFNAFSFGELSVAVAGPWRAMLAAIVIARGRAPVVKTG